MRLSPRLRGFTLVELMVTTSMIGAVGLIIFSILYTGTILGAKNTAINTAHQQARVAMLNMLQDIHSAISLPALTDANAVAYPSPVPAMAAGISFQEWSSGPHRIIADANVGQNRIVVSLTTGGSNPTPVAGQHIIIPAYQLEGDIAAVSGISSLLSITLSNIYGPSLTPPVSYPTQTLPMSIKGTASTAGDVICFVTDRCSYTVKNGSLYWNWKGNSRVLGSDITNPTPFGFPNSGSLYYRFVAAIDLSTSDANSSNRGYKSANILLNRQVPQKARLTTYQ